MVGTKPQTTACFLSKAAWLVSIKLGPSALCVGDKFLVGTSLSLLLPIWMCMVECLYNDIIIILRFVHTVVQQQSINTRVTLRSLLSFFLFLQKKTIITAVWNRLIGWCAFIFQQQLLISHLIIHILKVRKLLLATDKIATPG